MYTLNGSQRHDRGGQMKTKLALLIPFVIAVSVTGSASARPGMTWASSHDNTLGIDRVGCNNCNAYQGDTSCSVALPVLCLKVDGSPRPNYAVPSCDGLAMFPYCGYYNGWSRGHTAATVPVAGASLRSITAGDAFCASQFGAGWKMAEFHDGKWLPDMGLNAFYGNAANWNSASPWLAASASGGGWNFYAYGNLSPDTRYWVKINGQPANCWN